MTTQRTADLLGVSRPYLIAYQKRRDVERKAALDRIAKEAFESEFYDRTGVARTTES